MRTYPGGYRPDVLAKFTNLKVYRNSGQGFFFHISSNIEIIDSMFADNGIAIDFDRTFSPAIRVTNVSIIGQTTNFYNTVRVPRYGSVCRMKQNIGIEVTSFTQQLGSTAYVLRNVAFTGFDHGSCSYSFPISFESSVRKTGIGKHLPDFDYFKCVLLTSCFILFFIISFLSSFYLHALLLVEK
jgi:hypothetical protein